MDFSKKDLHSYLDGFAECLRSVKTTDKSGFDMDLADAVKGSIKSILQANKEGGRIVFIGNGGSAAIASHQATDFMRTHGIAAFSPTEHSLLTCMGNDVGYENIFSQPLKILGTKKDLLIAISSSGKSQNIINAVGAMRGKGAGVITMSGFGQDNPLRKLGDINFYIPSDSYRHVESAHLFICNWILDFVDKFRGE